VDYAHLHIVLNHFPTTGTVIGLGLFIAALLMKSDDLRQAALVLLVLMALLGIPTYITGSTAEGIVRADAGVSRAAIQMHQNAAMLAFAFLSITGLLSWFALWQYRRFSRVPDWNLTSVLLLSILTVGLMVRTGIVGGQINHPEIRAEEVAASEQITGWRTAAQTFILDRSWVWPASETLHFIGMALLFGPALVLSLCMLGLMKDVSFAALHRLLPLGLLGFGISMATGMVFFIGDAERYVAVPAFFLKIFLIVLAGINVVYFTSFDHPWA
jgi:uncharacterized membrane protein